MNGCGVKIIGISNTIQARHTRHHNHIPATRQQCRGSTQSHLLNLVIYREILFDVGIGGWKICLWLIVIVVRHEILNRILWKEVLELAIELRRQRLVVTQNDCRAVKLSDNICHRKGLTRTRHTHKGIMRHTTLNRLYELGNGFGLISRRQIFRDEFEIHITKICNNSKIVKL